MVWCRLFDCWQALYMKTILIIFFTFLANFIMAQDLVVKPIERRVYHINPLDTSQQRLAIFSQYDSCGNLVEDILFKYTSFSEIANNPNLREQEDWRITYRIRYSESCLQKQVKEIDGRFKTTKKTIYKYDNRNNVISKKVNDSKGKFIENTTYEYNDSDQLAVETHFNAKGKIAVLITYFYNSSLLRSKEKVNFETQDTTLFDYHYSPLNELEKTEWYVRNNNERGLQGFELVTYSGNVKYVTYKTEIWSQYFVNSFYANGLERGWETVWSDSNKTESIVIYKYTFK